MKKTLLSTAGVAVLALTVGAGAALADNNLRQSDHNFAAQDFLNDSLNDNLAGNTLGSGNDNDRFDIDASNVANNNGNGNGSNNTLGSGNDDDRYDVDVSLRKVGNKKLVLDYDGSENWQQDNSLDVSNLAVLINYQYLDAYAARVQMHTRSGDITTGSIEFGDQTNFMAAGNLTNANDSGVGTISQAASGVQANGTINLR